MFVKHLGSHKGTGKTGGETKAGGLKFSEG